MIAKNRIRAFISYQLALTGKTVSELARASHRGRSNYTDMIANNPLNLRLVDCENLLDYLDVKTPEERLAFYREVTRTWQESKADC